MPKAIDDTDLCGMVADELVHYEVTPGAPTRWKRNIALAVRTVAALRAIDEKHLDRRIQRRFKANGPAYMRAAVDRRAAALRAEMRDLKSLRATLS